MPLPNATRARLDAAIMPLLNAWTMTVVRVDDLRALLARVDAQAPIVQAAEAWADAEGGEKPRHLKHERRLFAAVAAARATGEGEQDE